MTTTDAEVKEPQTQEKASSFAKSLFLGEIHEDLVFPYPRPEEERGAQDPRFVRWLREYAAEEDRSAGDRGAGLGRR